jgi:hypothetical protein
MKPAEFTPVVSCPQCGTDILVARHREMTTTEALGLVAFIVGFFVCFLLVMPFIFKYLKVYYDWCEQRFDC